MLNRFLTRHSEFFVIFRSIADLLVEGAKEFELLLAAFPKTQEHAQKIKDIEHKADELTHRTIELLHKTFVTPLDREDIHLLVSRLDDIMDFLDAASQRMHLYEIKDPKKESTILAGLVVRAVEHVRQAVQALEDLKNPQAILKSSVEINRIENEADHVLRTAVANLFKNETDVRELIKLKEIFELLETVTDRCEDVANIIEGIVLEYA